MVPVLGRRAAAWYLRYGVRRRTSASGARGGRALALLAGTSDIEYLFPIGWSELEGIANRGDFDLDPAQRASGTKLE